MFIRRSTVFAVAVLLTAAGQASAQDKKVGLTMGYPSAFGVVWHVTDKVALRPELSLAGGSSETTASAFSSNSDVTTIATGISALFYLNTADKLRTYVSPRFTYSHSTTDQDLSSITNSSAKSTSSNTGGQGSFGAQYYVSDRFAVFGELGIGFAHTENSSNATTTKGSAWAWGTRSAVGIVFYP
jgi:hypothetical protein